MVFSIWATEHMHKGYLNMRGHGKPLIAGQLWSQDFRAKLLCNVGFRLERLPELIEPQPEFERFPCTCIPFPPEKPSQVPHRFRWNRIGLFVNVLQIPLRQSQGDCIFQPRVGPIRRGTTLGSRIRVPQP